MPARTILIVDADSASLNYLTRMLQEQGCSVLGAGLGKEEIIGLPIQKAIPYMGSNFALANNLNQPIITRYPEDTTAIVLKDTANKMINLANTLRGS
jgi:CheY-like chemotaxis protein